MMRNRNKRLIQFTAMILSLVFLLCACAPQTTTTTTKAATGSSAAGTTAAATTTAGKPAELVIGFWLQTAIPKDFQLVFDEVNKILLRDINAKLVTPVVLNFGNYREQLTLMLSGGEHLDAFSCYASDFVNYVTRGQIIAMDQYLNQYGSKIIDTVGKEFLVAGQVNGKQYGLTTNRDLAVDTGFYMSKAIVDKYKIDLTKLSKLEDWTSVFATIKAGEPNMIMVAPGLGTNGLLETLRFVDPLSDGLGVLMNYGQDSLKVENYFATEEYAYYCKFFREWFKKGYISENAMTTNDAPGDLIRAGRAFSSLTNLKPGYDLKQSKVTGVPVVSDPVTKTFTASTIVQTAQWVIAHNSKEPAATMKFLNKMYTDKEVTNLLAWGIKDKHYAIQSDGLINYPTGVTAENIGYNLNLGWVFGNQFATYIWQGDAPTLWKDTDTWNRSAMKSKAFGFTYDGTSVKTEIAAVSNVTKEYRRGLEYGVLDPTTGIPEFNAKLKAAGLDKIIAEKQKQLDAWAAAQKK